MGKDIFIFASIEKKHRKTHEISLNSLENANFLLVSIHKNLTSKKTGNLKQKNLQKFFRILTFFANKIRNI